jgi:CRP-like cAMP-binding protein
LEHVTNDNRDELSIEAIGRELSKLPGAVSLSNLSTGTRLYDSGDNSDHVYLLRSGYVKLYRLGRGGKHCIFGVVEEGQLFGEGALLGESRRRTAAEVLEKASVTMVSKETVLDYAKGRPEFWKAFAPFLGRKIQLLEEQLQWLCFLDVEQRLARLLLQWAQSGRPHSGDSDPQIRLSQKELAGLVGATRETTSSALNRLQRAGCVEIGRRRLMIRSIEKLAEYAQEGAFLDEPVAAFDEDRADREPEADDELERSRQAHAD